MSQADDGVTYETPLRTCDADGSHHFSQLKKLALSGKQYLHACNTTSEPTRSMLIGTCVHHMVLGQRPTAKPLVCFPGPARRGKEWDAFALAHAGSEIMTFPEWSEAQEIAEAVLRDPVARERRAGARFETPLRWEEDGLIFSTTGIDILTANAKLGDLKTTTTTFPDAWTRQAFKMLYPQQLAFYRRGARATGLDVSGGLFLLGVETKPPYEVVDLELTEAMIEFADKTVSLWLSKLKTYKESNQWPGYAQSPVPFDVPAWMQHSDDEEEDEAA